MEINYCNNRITLTAREKETLILMIKGLCNHKIAEELCVSVHTVKAHIESLFYKFGVHNKVEAVVFAFKSGIISLDEI